MAEKILITMFVLLALSGAGAIIIEGWNPNDEDKQ